VLVKLSDFGLVKDKDSDYTRTTSEMRGTIRDPQLENFKDYNVLNEIYSIGWVLNYIFTGSESLRPGKAEVADIVQKCVAHDLTRRYQSVRDVIADVETLEVTSSDAPASVSYFMRRPTAAGDRSRGACDLPTGARAAGAHFGKPRVIAPRVVIRRG
jgi:serine/threonine protein kinase